MEEMITPAQLGRRGGKKTAELHGAEHYRKMQAIGVENRKKKKLALKIPIDKR